MSLESSYILQDSVREHESGKQAEASKDFGLGLDERNLDSRAVERHDSSSILDESLWS